MIGTGASRSELPVPTRCRDGQRNRLCRPFQALGCLPWGVLRDGYKDDAPSPRSAPSFDPYIAKHGSHKPREAQLDIYLALRLKPGCNLGCRLLLLPVRGLPAIASRDARLTGSPLDFFFGVSLPLSSPRSMPGGDLHWIWKPYSLYMKIDYVSHETYQTP